MISMIRFHGMVSHAFGSCVRLGSVMVQALTECSIDVKKDVHPSKPTSHFTDFERSKQ